MIEGFMYKTILHQWELGQSKKYISRTLGINIKTVRKIIKKYEKENKNTVDPIVRKSRLEKYKEEIVNYLELGFSNIRIFEKLRNQGLDCAYSTVTNYTRKIKLSADVCVRFHTKEGEEAQVDFGYVGKLPNNMDKIKKAWIFNMRLSYSRLDYHEIVFDQQVATFIQCHINAFSYFGGVPKVVKIDNLKSAIIEASFYEPTFQTLYENFSKHYNFEILPCRVRKPQEKGKIENSIKYVKNNFFVGRSFANNKDLLNQLKCWQDDYCNKRIHGTTKAKPYDLYEKYEKAKLTALPLEEFKQGIVFTRKVHKDCHITVDNNYYSVPYNSVGEEVVVELSTKFVTIYHREEKIAYHKRLKGKGSFATNPSHYPKYKNYTKDSKEYLTKYEEKMSLVGKHTCEMFSNLVKENPNMWYRQVRGILSLRKMYSDEVIDLACQRAIYFGAIKYSIVKNICAAGTYNLPLEPNNKIV